jgi:hypothetical protein
MTWRLVHPPLGGGRTAEGSPGRAAAVPRDTAVRYTGRLSPPPGPLTRADLPSAEPRYSEGSATQIDGVRFSGYFRADFDDTWERYLPAGS